jgi:DNA-binding transcriptional regulator YiaG
MTDRSFFPDADAARELARDLGKKARRAKPKLKKMARQLTGAVQEAKAKVAGRFREGFSDGKLDAKHARALETLRGIQQSGSLDVSEIAERVGVTPSTVRAWANGTRAPKPANLDRLADVLTPKKSAGSRKPRRR